MILETCYSGRPGYVLRLELDCRPVSLVLVAEYDWLHGATNFITRWCLSIRLPVHMTSSLIQISTSVFPTFLSRSNRLRISYRNRSFMSTTLKRSPGVEQVLLHATKNEVKVDLDPKPNEVGVIEDNKSQWQAGLDQSTPTSKASNVKQDPDLEECLGTELKRPKTRQSLHKNKDLVPEITQEKETQKASKKVKLEARAEVQHVTRALTVTRGGSQPWQCSQDPAREGWGTFRIGTSGYVYKHWKNIVYEEGVAQKHWFEMYTRLFDTVEINNTFYRLPAPEVFESWRDQAPSGFCYALKFSRYLTQMKRLKDPEGPISLFLERANRLGNLLLGPILVQLPPRFDLNLERLECFLKQAPRQYRWAIEFRDSRWLVDDVYALLRASNASLVIHDHEAIPSLHPQVVTANWVYLRFHGRNYTERYSLVALQKHAAWIRAQMEAGRDVFVYFNNDMSGHAVFNALELREFVLGSEESLKS